VKRKASSTSSALASLFILLLGATFGILACAGPAVDPNARPVQIGSAEDALEGEGRIAELVGGLPALFLVGTGQDSKALLAMRQRLASDVGDGGLVTLIDVSSLDELQQLEISDIALEAALEEGGPILLDRLGSSAQSLLAGRTEPWLACVSSDFQVHDEANPATIDPAALIALSKAGQ